MFQRACLLAFIAMAVCERKPPPAGVGCKTLLEKLDRCDPGAKDMPASMRAELTAQCPPGRAACQAIDVSADGGCTRLMGCLYDGE